MMENFTSGVVRVYLIFDTVRFLRLRITRHLVEFTMLSVNAIRVTFIALMKSVGDHHAHTTVPQTECFSAMVKENNMK